MPKKITNDDIRKDILKLEKMAAELFESAQTYSGAEYHRKMLEYYDIRAEIGMNKWLIEAVPD